MQEVISLLLKNETPEKALDALVLSTVNLNLLDKFHSTIASVYTSNLKVMFREFVDKKRPLTYIDGEGTSHSIKSIEQFMTLSANAKSALNYNMTFSLTDDFSLDTSLVGFTVRHGDDSYNFRWSDFKTVFESIETDKLLDTMKTFRRVISIWETPYPEEKLDPIYFAFIARDLNKNSARLLQIKEGSPLRVSSVEEPPSTFKMWDGKEVEFKWTKTEDTIEVSKTDPTIFQFREFLLSP